MADTMNRAVDTAKGAVSKLKSILPDENEQMALREKQRQIDAATLPNQTAPATQTAPAEQDKVNPLGKYGSRPGEKRIDTSDMTKPLTPVYDNGGDVKVPMHTLGGNLKYEDDHKMTVKETRGIPITLRIRGCSGQPT